MIRINLAPREARRRAGGFTLPSLSLGVGLDLGLIFGVLYVLAVLGVGYAWWSLSAQESRLNAEIARGNQELASLKVTLGQGANVKAQLADFKKRVEVLEKLLKGQSRPIALLDSFADVEWSDPHTALSVDFREPELFTFQYDTRIPPITFPGKVPVLAPLLDADDPNLAQSGREFDVATLDARIAGFAGRVANIAERHEVYVGSWGVLQRADDDSARRYVHAARSAFERHGFAWALYDYHSGCAVRGADGKPIRVLEGLALTRGTTASGTRSR